MRAPVVMMLVAAGSAPILTGVGLDWLHVQDVRDVMGGANVTDVAQQIAQREFAPNVRLAFLGSTDSPTVLGEFNETLRPFPGDVYRHVSLEVTDGGRLDVAVHTYHFSAVLDSGQKVGALVGVAEKFEVMQLPSGGSARGTIVFEVPQGATLARIVWQGELANATLDLSAPTSLPAS